jgi:hypothetical protein
MTPHYPAATAVERTQARVERSYLREDGTPKLCMGKDSEADERSLLELWDAIFGRELKPSVSLINVECEPNEDHYRKAS